MDDVLIYPLEIQLLTHFERSIDILFFDIFISEKTFRFDF